MVIPVDADRAPSPPRFVAKVLKKETYSSEALHLSQCHHPNIISFVESFDTSTGHTCVITELANRGDLGQHIEKRRTESSPFSENETILMFIQLALAVDYMHSRRMLHRDIKSHNVLLFHTGLVKLGDFGLTRQYDESVSQEVAITYCGTPEYLAPEIWGRNRYGKKADLYSLGVVLYEMASMRLPFRSIEIADLSVLVRRGHYEPVPEHFSHDFTTVVTRLLDVDPAARPSVPAIFRIPKWNEGLRMFVQLMAGHAELSEGWKQKIMVQALDVLAEVSVPSRSPVTATLAKRRWRDEEGWRDIAVDLNQQGVIILVDEPTRRFVLDTVREHYITENREGEGHILVMNVDGLGELCLMVTDSEAWIRKLSERTL
jgi:serine/threonine protein kinase